MRRLSVSGVSAICILDSAKRSISSRLHMHPHLCLGPSVVLRHAVEDDRRRRTAEQRGHSTTSQTMLGCRENRHVVSVSETWQCLPALPSARHWAYTQLFPSRGGNAKAEEGGDYCWMPVFCRTAAPIPVLRLCFDRAVRVRCSRPS